MTLPHIYTQPACDLENFEMSGYDLAVTRHFLAIVEDKELKEQKR